MDEVTILESAAGVEHSDSESSSSSWEKVGIDSLESQYLALESNAGADVAPWNADAEFRAEGAADPTSNDSIVTEFGHPQYKNFLIDPTYLNLNQGSYGCASVYVLNAQHAYVRCMESRPDVWFRETFYQLIIQTRQVVAAEVNVEPNNLVLLENASAAVNGIFRSLSLKRGDVFVYLSTAYGMVKNTARWLAEDRGICTLEIPIEFPVISAEQSFLEPLRSGLAKLSDSERAQLKVATFSHISSCPALIEPIKAMADIVKAANPAACVLVDGAHALGQIAIDIPSLGNIDYYLSNGHKWFFAPKGSCFLWTASPNISTLRPQPTVISSANTIDSTAYVDRFSYTGTKDFSAYICMKDAYDFRAALGGEVKIRTYTNGLAAWAGDYLVERWGTRRLSPKEFEANMVNIVLPTADLSRAQAMQRELLDKEGVYMLALQDVSSGLVFTRLSASIFLEQKDFVHVGELVARYLMSVGDTYATTTL